jgi:hypothetical protein
LCDDHASMVPASGPFRQIGPDPLFPPQIVKVHLGDSIRMDRNAQRPIRHKTDAPRLIVARMDHQQISVILEADESGDYLACGWIGVMAEFP